MPAPYDIEEARRSFDGFEKDYLISSCATVPEFPGNLARAHMDSVIKAWILGRADEVEQPLRTLAEWFERADAADERFGESPLFHAAQRHEAHGVCAWMLGRPGVPGLYRRAVESWERHFQSEGKQAKRGGPRFDYEKQRYEDPFITGLPFEAKDILQGSLQDYLASCVQSGEFARGLALYSKVGGDTEIADARIQAPVHFGFWLCRQGAAGGIDREACEAIGGRVLRAHVRTKWLGAGQWMRATQWLKVVAEASASTASPRQVLQRASTFITAKPARTT